MYSDERAKLEVSNTPEDELRIALHVCPASYLGQVHGDAVLIANLLAGLRDRGHQVKIVSRVDVRDFWRGRLLAHRLIAEALLARRDMKRFSPDAWLVYSPKMDCPDLFGWWQDPKRYVVFGDVSYNPRFLLRSIGPGHRRGRLLPRPWRWLFPWIHRRSLGRADAIAVFRAKIANQLRSLGVPAERLCLLPMPIRAWRAVPGRAESRSRLGLPQDSPVILCVSQFTLRKHEDDPIPGKTEALVDLLDAFAALPSDTLLVLVGDGKGRKELESRVSRLKIEGRVRFVGEVEHDDLCWFYAACNFFAFPDVFDMPRLAILEAQACGRPVVTMQTDSAQLTVDAGRTGLLARNLEEFQVHLRALVRDKDRCEEMGRAGPEYIAGFHSIEAFASQIEELLIGRCGAVESKLGHTGTPN